MTYIVYDILNIFTKDLNTVDNEQETFRVPIVKEWGHDLTDIMHILKNIWNEKTITNTGASYNLSTTLAMQIFLLFFILDIVSIFYSILKMIFLATKYYAKFIG